MNTPLNLRFNGNRDYLQGPDMFNETMSWLTQHHSPQKITKIEFSFHKMVKSTVNLSDEKQEDRGEYAAECTYLVGTEPQHIYLYETGNAVLGRYPYDEDLICKDFLIDPSDKSGCLYGAPKGNTRFTDIEIWVALTKALHQQVLSEVKGKWLFVRARFPAYLQETNYRKRRLQIISNFQNLLTRTKLYGDEKAVGEIFFSVI